MDDFAEIQREALEKLQFKRIPARFQRYVDVLNDLLRTKSMLSGDTLAEDGAQFGQLVDHASELWRSAAILYLNENFSTAVAVAISCLEEVGKVAVARFEVVLREATREAGQVPPALDDARRRGPFYLHSRKHLLAAGAGAFINARLDRILGIERVAAFLDSVERGDIEALRQSCLYSERDGATLVIPSETMTRETATFYVVLAGELLAEVGGFTPEEFERLLQEVQEFETRIGHPHE